MHRPGFYAALANSILAGEASADAIASRLTHTLGREWRWVRPLVRRYLAEFGTGTRPRSRDVVKFLRRDEGIARALRLHRKEIRVVAWISPSHAMQPVRAARDWAVPAIESVGALADWLQVTPGELEWFADLKRMIARRDAETATGPLSHYHYRILA